MIWQVVKQYNAYNNAYLVHFSKAKIHVCLDPFKEINILLVQLI